MMSDSPQEKRVLCVGKVYADFMAIRIAPAPQQAADDKSQNDKPSQGKLSAEAQEK